MCLPNKDHAYDNFYSKCYKYQQTYYTGKSAI